jgi:predicted GNAT family acetyltransferase
MEARNSGVVRSVLFAEDPAAQQAYRALGFAVSGDYGLILFS